MIQHIIDKIGPEILQDILTRLRGKYVSLSMNKHGSNVVEKCLKESNSEQYTSMIIIELINSPHFLDVLQDPYGNYVAQSALEVSTVRFNSLIIIFITKIALSKIIIIILVSIFFLVSYMQGRTHTDLVRLVLMHEKSLHSHPHGKRVLQQARTSKKQRV